MRIVEHGARESDHVGLAFRDDRFRLPGGRDQSDHTGCNGRLAFDHLRKLHVHADHHGRAGIRADSTGRDADIAHADALERLGEGRGIGGGEPAFDPVIANGIDEGITARTAAATSTGKRMRPSIEPPY